MGFEFLPLAGEFADRLIPERGGHRGPVFRAECGAGQGNLGLAVGLLGLGFVQLVAQRTDGRILGFAFEPREVRFDEAVDRGFGFRELVLCGGDLAAQDVTRGNGGLGLRGNLTVDIDRGIGIGDFGRTRGRGRGDGNLDQVGQTAPPDIDRVLQF